MNGAVRRTLFGAISLLAIGFPAVVATAPAAHATTSAACTGNLQVTNTDNHTVIGFVSKTWNSFGEYVVTNTPSDYLSVSLTPGTEQNITTLNGQDNAVPLMGGIVGFASNSNNLGLGSPNYAYLGGDTATPAGSPPVSGTNSFTNATGIPEAIESAIWTIDDANHLSPQWINTDSSQPATHLMDITNILVLTGDTTAFQNTFGAASNVALTFVLTGTCVDNDLALTGVPANITGVKATSPAGAVVTYTPPTATDEGGGTPVATVSCTPASGSTFPIGTTTVTCTATDADDSNSPVTATFTVTVTGDMDLGLTGVPANIDVSATSSAGAVVTYTSPTATDEAGDSPVASVSCTPASGSTFPIGTTTVTCTATDTDDTNSPVTAAFTVTVKDSDLALTGVPANITGVNATSPAGAVVAYTPPTAVDEAGDSPAATVSCSPASGSTFPIGTTTVTCTATDPDDSNSPVSATFTVTVNDSDLALTGVPANITTTVNANGGAHVSYTAPTAVDELESPGPTVSCLPASGSFFPIGTTMVTCKATDADDTNSPVSARFSVTVTKSPTKTTVTANPTSAALGSPVTFTATVAPNPAIALTPTGAVSFFVDGGATPVATVALDAAGKASFTTSGLGAGTHTVTASYSGDSNFLASSATASVTVACGTTVTGNHNGLVVGPGTTCVLGGTITGSIVVPKGASVDFEGVTINGSVNSSGAAFFRMCGSSAASVTVTKSTGFVLIGDAGDDACAPNTLSGSLTLIDNTGGVEAIGNHVGGAVTASGNSGTGPFPEDTAPEITGNGH